MQNVKVTNNRDYTQNFIPFRFNKETIFFIREKNCFKKKWIDIFGKEFIQNRIKEYKKIIEKKPKGVIYWNPFIY